MGISRKLLVTILLGAIGCTIGLLLLDASSAMATSGYLNQFNSRYGTSTTALNTCSVCHTSIPNLNAYGNDFVTGLNFADIELLDSDGDGFTNLVEINALTSPGDAASAPPTQPTCTDNDGDGYAVEGGVCGPSDCNDLNAGVNPFAVEECGDFADNDCNGLTDAVDPGAVNCQDSCTDLDGDGYAAEGGSCGPVDCNDANAAVNPQAEEICGDGIDQDCSSSDLRCDAVLPPPSMSLMVNGLKVSVNWTPVAGATGYELLYAPYPYRGSETIGSFDIGSATNFSVDLWDNAAYYLAVKARNDEGSSDYSNIEYFILDKNANDEALSVPRISLDVDGVHVTVAWTAVPRATGYTLYYAPYSQQSIQQSMDSIDLGNATSFSADLWEGAAYYVAVTARNDHGSSNYSNYEYFIIETSPMASDGGQLYANNCASCHGALDRSNVAGGSAEDIEEAIYSNAGGMGYLSFLESTLIDVIAGVLALVSPPPVVVTGQSLYDGQCAGCHAVNGYDASGSPDLAAKGNLVAGKFASSHNGQNLAASQQTLMATFLNQYSAPTTGGGSCTSCHGQPPTGNSAPNRAGSHGVHTALNGINKDCASCHTGAAHNSVIDRGIISTWNAKSGAATGNSNGTCSSISCHGGVTTPNWTSGSIDVDAQCAACHTAGTTQYNSYSSGEHKKHVVDKKIACTQCHDTNLLRNGHFSNLKTSAFELAPSATIKSSLGYSGGRCATASCHGSKDWND